MGECDCNWGERILVVINGNDNTVHKQDQVTVLESDVEKNISPEKARLIPCLNNLWMLYSRQKLAVTRSAKYPHENLKKRVQHLNVWAI